MRRGLCYQTREELQQTDADDIGRLVLEIKVLPSITWKQYNYEQPQTVVYINDKFEQVLDFPRFYLYPNEWNRMHITARQIELLNHPNDCTYKLEGKDSSCIVRNWLWSTVILQHNCTLPYLDNVQGIPSGLPTCDPLKIAQQYNNVIQRVHSGAMKSQKCIPGCKRWEYSVSLQQSPSLQPFANFLFNLEVSFYDLQYEHVKEVITITFPGFMSQIGGQFGFFLGLSIITVIQSFITFVSIIVRRIINKTNFLGNREKVEKIFALFGISVEEREQGRDVKVGERQRGRDRESSQIETIEQRENLSDIEMRVMGRRRTKSEKDEETMRKRRVPLTKQKSFDDSEIANC